MATDYGRKAGWVAERDGVPVAVLTDSRFEDMHWYSYRLEIVAQDLAAREEMLTEEFWRGNGWRGLVWRNRESGEVAEFAFPAASPFTEQGRLMMRGLYLQ